MLRAQRGMRGFAPPMPRKSNEARQYGRTAMKVGIPREIKNHEYRVAITPAGVHELVRGGHEVLIEAGAGEGSSIPDADFVAAGAKILPTADDVQVRRARIALEQGAKTRLFVLNTAPVYGRIEVEVSLAENADFELFGANIGTGLSTNEIVTNVKHIGVDGRSRQTIGSTSRAKCSAALRFA